MIVSSPGDVSQLMTREGKALPKRQPRGDPYLTALSNSSLADAAQILFKRV